MELKSTDFVQSLDRGLSVIRAFDADNPQLTLSDVAKRTNLTRAAARRFLLTLEHLGYVRSDRKLFALRPSVLELGFSYLSSFGLPEISTPHLETLVQEVQQSSSISVLDGTDIIYVARVAMRRIMSVNINVGTRLPAYSTSMGRALLSELTPEQLDAYFAAADISPLTAHTVTEEKKLRELLAEVRAQGWALIDQELEQGLRAIAVPLHDASGRAVAAINVSLPSVNYTRDEILADVLPPLLRAAASIEADYRAIDKL